MFVTGYLVTEMEKDGRSGRAACANFPQPCLFLFVFHAIFSRFAAFFVCNFLAFLQVFESFLHLFWVKIFQACSFASDIM